MKKLGTLLCFIVSVCLLATSNTVQASEKTVRVAFLPEMYGFCTMEENGGYSGYNYDYIMNVAQHTGWKVEFVEISEGSISSSLAKAGEMLASEELDIVGPFTQMSSYFQEFETCSNNYGLYRYNIYSARDNYAVTEDNYFLKESISIALVESYTDINRKFLDLVESRGLNYDITYVQTHAESLELLLSEQVDTIINLDMSSNTQFLDYLTVVDRVPFYFASTKGNTELIAELDQAIEDISVIEPDFHQELLETYFGVRYEGEFLFIDEEKNQMEKQGVFKVGLERNTPPYQFVDENGNNAGITVEVIEQLSEIIGMPFEIVWFDTIEELVQASDNGEIDLIGSVSSDYELAQNLNVTLTKSYLSSGVYWLKNHDETANPQIKYHYVSDNIPHFHDDDLTRVTNIKEDIETMASTGTISIFCNPYIAEYYINSLGLDNIDVQSVSNVNSEISFGVSSHIEKSLISMLNRAIYFLDEGELDEVIFRYTAVRPEYTLEDAISDFYFEIIIGISFVAVIIIFIIYSYAKKFRELSRRDGLTKLYNAGYFHDYASRKIPTLSAGTLIIMDIDYFKQVNDSHGHHKGDEIIKAVAEILKRHFRTDDVVARLGGDEFVVLLEHETTSSELEKRCQEILEELSHPETQVPVTLSIGGYSFQNTNDYNEMYKKADDELYKVKEKGRNGFSFYSQEK